MRSKYLDSMDPERIFNVGSLPKGSKIWNFIASCRHVILPHMSWLVKDGSRAHFLEDSWNNFPPLIFIPELLPIYDLLKVAWGPKVNNYWFLKSSFGITFVE